MKPETEAETYRTFIALALPREVIDYLVKVQRCLKDRGARGRWVRPESIHLTLKFLGDTPVNQLESVADALDTVARSHAALELTAGGLGGFPNRRRPRVLWVGIGSDRGHLVDLQQAVDTAMASLDWPLEKRPFRGHLTIGRAKGRGVINGDIDNVLARCEPAETMGFTAGHLTLYRSLLRPDGAIYERLGQWALRKDA